MKLSQEILVITEALFNEEMTPDDYKKIIDNIIPEGIHKNYPGKPDYSRVIGWAMRVLKKNNRIIWFLRWYAFRICYSTLSNSNLEKAYDSMEPIVKGFAAKAGREVGQIIDAAATMSIDDLLSNLEHYFNPMMQQAIPNIRNYSFQYQTPQEALGDFKGFEDEHSVKTGGLSLKVLISPEEMKQYEPRAEELIEFPNGWAWWDLHTYKSQAEHKSGNNCGTAEKTDSFLLSLRRPIKLGNKTYLKTELTAELTSNGNIRQLRHGNEKPEEVYHPYIMKLLMGYDEIVGFELPDYSPNDIFLTDDLSEEDQKELGKHNRKLLEEPQRSTNTDFEIYDELVDDCGNWLGIDNWNDARKEAKQYLNGLSATIFVEYEIVLNELEVSENDIEFVDSERISGMVGDEQEEPDCTSEHKWVENTGTQLDEVEVDIEGNDITVSCTDAEMCVHCGAYRVQVGTGSSLVLSKNPRGRHEDLGRFITIQDQFVYLDADEESEAKVKEYSGVSDDE